jgi:hypothetical protein
MVPFHMFDSFLCEPGAIAREFRGHFRQASKKRTHKSAFPRPPQPGGSPLTFPLFPQRVNIRPTHQHPQPQSAHRFTSYFSVYRGVGLRIPFLWPLTIFPALLPSALFARPLEGALSTILFGFRTYEKGPHNSLRMSTSKTQHLKFFRIRTYQKTGRGGTQKIRHSILFAGQFSCPA